MSRWRNSLGKVLHVGWRDFRYTALTPAFLIAVVGVPVLLGLAALVIYPILLSQETSTLEGRVVVIERGGGFAGILEDILERGIRNEAAEQVAEAFSRLPGSGLAGGPGLGFMNVPTDIELVRSGDPSFLEEAKQGVREERFLAVAMVPDALLRVPPADPPDDYLEPELGLYIPNDAPPQHVATLEQLLQEAVVESRAVNAGYSYDEIRRVIETPMMEVVRITETGEEGDLLELRIIIPIALMMLLWTIAFTSGNYVLTSTIEEKSNKVMEVLLSAVSPMQLMAGKILGQAAVASLMFVMYGGIAIIGLVTLAMTDLLSLQLLLLSFAYFVIAYFTIATLMAAVGSAVSELRDAQSLMGPAVLVLCLPLVLWIPINNNPSSVFAVVTGFIPPLVPFVMTLRVAASPEPLPAWQILTSLVLGTGTVGVMLWMSARIFRVGVLMQGKPPSPVELLRWIRYR